jgi:mRNA interferase MazF
MIAGEIYLANFPFGGSPGMKLRPVLLLTGEIGSVPEVLVAYLSSVIPADVLPSDMVVDPKQPEFASTNLKKNSVIRLHKLATIHVSSLVRFLGILDASPMADIAAKLRVLLNL